MNLARGNALAKLKEFFDSATYKQGCETLATDMLLGIEEILRIEGSDEVVESMARSLISSMRKEDAAEVAAAVRTFLTIIRNNPNAPKEAPKNNVADDSNDVDEDEVPNEFLEFLRDLKEELGSSFGPVLKDLTPLLLAASKFTSAGRVVTVLELLLGAKADKDQQDTKQTNDADPLGFLKDLGKTVGSDLGRLVGLVGEEVTGNSPVLRNLADDFEDELINDVDGRLSVEDLLGMTIGLAVAYQPAVKQGRFKSDSIIDMLVGDTAKLIEESGEKGIKTRHALQLVHNIRKILDAQPVAQAA